ncbi:MAG: Spy/CpxP family protein refolding chaperone [Alphaproteobacteria bacterium]|nr:Spy/CpxP family protein refolding chaperone [Alphaproteobacteria bacterium]
MSRNSSRSVVAGLVSGWLIIVGSPVEVAGGQPPARISVILAQAQPNPAPAPDVEANIASLHQRLQITPAQEAPFGVFANALRANARAEASAPHQPPANASAVDELRAEIQYDEVELAGLKKLLPALEALYASLSPAQRQAADAAFRGGPRG